jgi:hypothetical protein
MPGLAALLLLLGAALHLAVLVVSRSVMVGSFDPAPLSLIWDLTRAMPLVLAASLVAGRDRWPAGRRWLNAAIAAFALSALLSAAGWLAISVNWPPDEADPSSLLNAWRITLMVAASVAAPLLAALGLWRGRALSRSPTSRAAWLVAALAVAGLVLAVQVLAVLPYYDDILPFFDGENQEPLLATMSAIGMLEPVAFAVLGIVAVRAAPRRYIVPEVLIAAGALIAAAASALITASSVTLMRAMDPPSWATQLTVANALSILVGLALLALGFFMARISAPGEA